MLLLCGHKWIFTDFLWLLCFSDMFSSSGLFISIKSMMNNSSDFHSDTLHIFVVFLSLQASVILGFLIFIKCHENSSLGYKESVQFHVLMNNKAMCTGQWLIHFKTGNMCCYRYGVYLLFIRYRNLTYIIRNSCYVMGTEILAAILKNYYDLIIP